MTDNKNDINETKLDLAAIGSKEKDITYIAPTGTTTQQNAMPMPKAPAAIKVDSGNTQATSSDTKGNS